MQSLESNQKETYIIADTTAASTVIRVGVQKKAQFKKGRKRTEEGRKKSEERGRERRETERETGEIGNYKELLKELTCSSFYMCGAWV